MKYPADMDVECVRLCDALNALPGITTSESCCGHGKNPYLVIFRAEHIQDLRPILMATHSSAWSVDVNWANGGDTIYFCLAGPVGADPAMPGGANDLAGWIRENRS